MRGLFGLLVVALLVFGVYYFYMRQMPATDQGTAPTQAISLTGVRTDLMQIGQAERGFVAQNGRCASLDELISSNSITMTRSGRDGYSYSVECSGSTYSVTATHPAASEGSGIRFPTLSLDETMQVREVTN
jgi:hypothetical protein